MSLYIDLVTGLSSAAFIACFERFIAQRGHCNKLVSDNGTSFIGAYKEIKQAFEKWSAPETIEHLNKNGTKWTFMSPAAPHQGGIYEAAVKSTKYHLKRVIGAKSFTYEYFLTFLKKVESILNSRPLYALTDDPSDAQCITPAHFLIGESFIVPPPIAVPTNTNVSLQKIHEEQQKMLNSYWNSWNKDFLSSLLPRKKWLEEHNVQIGQLVLISDENLPPGKWLLGKIREILPSRDGVVRDVIIELSERKKPKPGEKVGERRTKKRAVQKLCFLPLDPNEINENDNEILSHSACDDLKQTN